MALMFASTFTHCVRKTLSYLAPERHLLKLDSATYLTIIDLP